MLARPETGWVLYHVRPQQPAAELDDYEEAEEDPEQEQEAGADGQQQQQQQQDAARQVCLSAVGRRVPVTLKGEDRPVILVAHYISRQLQQAPPMGMLREAIVDQLPADVAESLPPYQIAWTYDQQLKPLVLNARVALSKPNTIEGLLMTCLGAGVVAACLQTRSKSPLGTKQ